MRPSTLCVGFCLFGAAAFFGDKTIGPSIACGDEVVWEKSPEKEEDWWQAPTVHTAPKTQLDSETPCSITKDCTHIFVINGNDPLCVGGLNQFSHRIELAGYKNVYSCSLRGYWYAERKICSIRKEDPRSTIVIIGYSWGANVARVLCHSLEKKGICVDLLIYLSGDMVGNIAYSRPENAKRIVNINAHGLLLYGGDLFWNGDDIEGATNYRIDCMHLRATRRPEVLEIALAAIAAARCP